jgi:hypothetical protein
MHDFLSVLTFNLIGDGEPQDPHLHGIRPAIQLLCGRCHGPPRETIPPGSVVEPEPSGNRIFVTSGTRTGTGTC